MSVRSNTVNALVSEDMSQLHMTSQVQMRGSKERQRETESVCVCVSMWRCVCVYINV